MKIEVRENSELILFAEDKNQPERHIFLYKLTPLNGSVKEKEAEDYYIAVPNGKNIALMDLPEGSYELRRMNRKGGYET